MAFLAEGTLTEASEMLLFRRPDVSFPWTFFVLRTKLKGVQIVSFLNNAANVQMRTINNIAPAQRLNPRQYHCSLKYIATSMTLFVVILEFTQSKFRITIKVIGIEP